MPTRRARGHSGRPDGRAGPLGRRVPGLGRARRLPGHRPGRPGRAGCSGCPAEELRELVERLVPVRRSPDQRALPHGPVHRVDARQRESLVTLGTLAAGLAHEINNPAAAATRAVDALEAACQTLLASLAGSPQGDITAAPVRRPGRAAPRAPTAGGRSRPARPRRPRDRRWRTWLGRHGVERAWPIAPSLAAAGVDLAWCERVADVRWTATALEPALEWVASTFSVDALLGEVKESTRRVSELVAAVRSYSQMDRASLQQIDVTDGLESTLVMLGHKLRDGSPSCATTRRTSRRSRPTPASSTRSGPT